MKKWFSQTVSAAVILSLAGGSFYLREQSQPEQMRIPVTQVLSYSVQITPTPTPVENFQLQREMERMQSVTALTRLSENGDENAGEYLLQLIERGEMELVIESALAAAGYAPAVCAVRDGAVTICLQQRIDAAQAQWMIELCEKTTGECAENVFILDESGYSW